MDEKLKDKLKTELEQPVPLSITELQPSSRAINDTEFDLHVIGLGLNHNSMITFDRNNRPTTYHSDTDVSTTINPATAAYEGVYSVTIKDGAIESNELPFTFTPKLTAQQTEEQKDEVLHRGKIPPRAPASAAPHKPTIPPQTLPGDFPPPKGPNTPPKK